MKGMSIDERTCLITGATSGIGKAAAQSLARMGFGLILLGRNKEKLQRVCYEISRETRRDRIDPRCCDLSVMKDVLAIATKIKGTYNRIDVLINNAGARFLKHKLTPEGIELTLATNHLGPYALTLSLIGALKRQGAGRIINVSSGAHSSGTGIIENILIPENYDGRRQYANSKLANILFTYSLSERLRAMGITVNSVDPGGVATNFARNNGLVHWLKHRLYYLAKRELLSPAQGAETIVYLASSQELSGVTGKHFFRKQEAGSSRISYDPVLQAGLWSLSHRLSGVDLEFDGL